LAWEGSLMEKKVRTNKIRKIYVFDWFARRGERKIIFLFSLSSLKFEIPRNVDLLNDLSSLFEVN
jgi:hypothetical protein